MVTAVERADLPAIFAETVDPENEPANFPLRVYNYFDKMHQTSPTHSSHMGSIKIDRNPTYTEAEDIGEDAFVLSVFPPLSSFSGEPLEKYQITSTRVLPLKTAVLPSSDAFIQEAQSDSSQGNTLTDDVQFAVALRVLNFVQHITNT